MQGSVLSGEPVKLQHEARDGQAPGHLERHSANQVHPVPSVRVKR